MEGNGEMYSMQKSKVGVLFHPLNHLITTTTPYRLYCISGNLKAKLSVRLIKDFNQPKLNIPTCKHEHHLVQKCLCLIISIFCTSGTKAAVLVGGKTTCLTTSTSTAYK